MTRKILLSVATVMALGLGSATAFAQTTPPWPECVNNPACQEDDGCTVSAAPTGSTGGVGAVVALAAAAALVARRRLAR